MPFQKFIVANNFKGPFEPCTQVRDGWPVVMWVDIYSYGSEFEVKADSIGCKRLRVVGSGYVDREHAAWIFTVIVEDRYTLQQKLRKNGIESNQVHFRNDRYTIFNEYTQGKKFPNMDLIEDSYLALPLHTMMNEIDVRRVCSVIKSGW